MAASLRTTHNLLIHLSFPEPAPGSERSPPDPPPVGPNQLDGSVMRRRQWLSTIAIGRAHYHPAATCRRGDRSGRGRGKRLFKGNTWAPLSTTFSIALFTGPHFSIPTEDNRRSALRRVTTAFIQPCCGQSRNASGSTETGAGWELGNTEVVCFASGHGTSCRPDFRADVAE